LFIWSPAAVHTAAEPAIDSAGLQASRAADARQDGCVAVVRCNCVLVEAGRRFAYVDSARCAPPVLPRSMSPRTSRIVTRSIRIRGSQYRCWRLVGSTVLRCVARFEELADHLPDCHMVYRNRPCTGLEGSAVTGLAT